MARLTFASELLAATDMDRLGLQLRETFQIALGQLSESHQLAREEIVGNLHLSPLGQQPPAEAAEII